MELIATRQLASYPIALALLTGGDLLVLGARDKRASLDVYDTELKPIRSTRLDGPALAMVRAADGTFWVLDSAGALAVETQRADTTRVHCQPGEDMQLSAFALDDDDIVFASQHATDAPMQPPRITRVSKDGTVRWSTTLPVRSVAHEGVVEMGRDTGWKPRPADPWMPETWLSTSRRLTVSGDALLACFSEMPRSGIGFGYVLSLSDGAIRFTTQQGPISEVAALSGGDFLVGYQGYGAFETLHYGRDGRIEGRWATHGHYAVAGDDIRVIEMENVLPSKMHLARIVDGGTVTGVVPSSVEKATVSC